MKRCLAALLVLCALLSLCACGAAAPETDGGTFSLDILDTGKSDCIIVCMDGVTVVNDAADEDDFDSICAALERRGVQRIDYLVLSHYDKDHIGSAAALVRAYPVGQILGPDYEENSMYLTLLKRAAEERNTPFLRLTENYTVETENGSFTLDPPDIDYGRRQQQFPRHDRHMARNELPPPRRREEKPPERVSRRRARQL